MPEAPFRELAIKAPNLQNHAANLCELPNGDLLCVWFSGTQEGMADISIYLARLPAGGTVWSLPEKMSDDPEHSEQNPVLFIAPDRKIWLLWTSQTAGNQDSAIVMHRVSEDGGFTWTQPLLLIGKPGTFVRQPVIVNAAGEWLLPVFHCRYIPGQKWVGDADYSGVMVSKDGGKTWKERIVPGSLGCVHMNIVPLGNDRFAAFFRSRWADFVHRSASEDGGKTWSQPVALNIPNNNSSIQCVRLTGGQPGGQRLALVYNDNSAAGAKARRESLYDEIEDAPAAPNAAEQKANFVAPENEEDQPPPPDGRKAFWGAPRAPLSLAFSDDEGLSWTKAVNLEEGDGFCLTNNSKDAKNREFSYPSIVCGRDGALHVAYTYFRQRIKYMKIERDQRSFR